MQSLINSVLRFWLEGLGLNLTCVRLNEYFEISKDFESMKTIKLNLNTHFFLHILK